ncbi:heme-binding protein [Nannocystis pusilla]|uniref:heme-binding protein n=1 Tax=Nannocystis pusilla TaxID=889268 RepID=UPI003B7CDDDC
MARLTRLGSVGAGLPIVVEGRAIGAIGVGGGTGESDLECVQAGLAALRETGAPREHGAVTWERRAGVEGR